MSFKTKRDRREEIILSLSKLKETKIKNEKEITKLKPIKERLNAIVKELLDCYVYISDSKYIYKHNNIFYDLITYESFNKDIASIFDRCKWNDFENRYANEIYERIRCNSIVNNINQQEYFPFKNAILNYQTMKVEQSTEKCHFTKTFNIEYATYEKCPRFDRFIERILPDKEKRALFFSFIAYCMTPAVNRRFSIS